MYKMVIADDEKILRQGLKNVVDWEELGFEVTEIFSDGQEIIEYLEYFIPDVILTDIKMSHVSGLDVAKYVFEQQLPCRVVLVSGYQEFELAVEGIRYGAEGYLLKPADVDKIIETFTKLKNKLDLRRQELEKGEAEKNRMEEAIPILEERFFTDLVMGVADSREYIQSRIGILYPDMDAGNSICLLADIYIEDFDEYMQSIWEYSYDQFELNLANFLRIYQKEFCFHIVYKAGNLIEVAGIHTGRTVLEREPQCTAALEELIGELEQSFRFRAKYEICRIYDSIFEIGNISEDARGRLKDLSALERHIQEQKKLIMSNIAVGNTVTAQKLFHSVLEELEALPAAKRNNLVIELLSTMNTVIKEINEKLSQSLQPYFNYSLILSMTKPEDTKAYCDRIFDRMKLAGEKKEYYDTNSLISKARQYIQDNVYKDISQEETANQLYICSSYLSRLFKKQTGESFTQYVTGIKMEKAIELLKDPQYKTYQVSEMLGYKTPRYFSRLFRNHTGMNPSEYRGRVLHLGGEYDDV